MAGIAGADGKDGVNGRDGVDGAKGIDGKDGIDGARGERGERGEQGIEGPRGKLPIVKEWSDGAVYYESDVVVRAGGTYQAVRDTARIPGEHVDWICLAVPGRDGIDGRSMTLRGTFDPNVKYSALDIVTLNSCWFAAKCDDPGECPGPNWKAGPVGKRGEKGERGEKGDKGISGATAREIIKFITDEKNYALIPVYSDGTLGSQLSIRSLFEQFQREAL
jgi:hypothetical protein